MSQPIFGLHFCSNFMAEILSKCCHINCFPHHLEARLITWVKTQNENIGCLGFLCKYASNWIMEIRENNSAKHGTVLNYGRLIHILSVFKCKRWEVSILCVSLGRNYLISNMRKHQSHGKGLLLLYHRKTCFFEISSARKSVSRVSDFIEEFYWGFFGHKW